MWKNSRMEIEMKMNMMRKEVVEAKRVSMMEIRT